MERRTRVLLGALAGAFFTACSVKEARRDCPVRLELDLTAFEEVARSVLVELDGQIFSCRLDSPDSLVRRLSVASQDPLEIRVWSGAAPSLCREGVLRVPEGEQSDSLFLFSRELRGRPEKALVRAVPHKQFATVTLRLFPAAGEPRPLRYTVRSDYGCLDLSQGLPVAGRLAIPLAPAGEESQFRLPRQPARGNLVLEAEDPSGGRETYPLGEWILSAGYDWTSPDLDDIVVGADFGLGLFTVEVAPWTAGGKMEQML